ncbi:RsmB/NOP family class I SAM-dependent RNA methyltransferase [Curtobacterium flaccumfaciens pv. flaccumfaciens]|nr:RsmB/NOP family class I SAM-dependent RNA methyltransferase [Curtobacterium flaccumfaciens pv. flaccumfaciens]
MRSPGREHRGGRPRRDASRCAPAARHAHADARCRRRHGRARPRGRCPPRHRVRERRDAQDRRPHRSGVGRPDHRGPRRGRPARHPLVAPRLGRLGAPRRPGRRTLARRARRPARRRQRRTPGAARGHARTRHRRGHRHRDRPHRPGRRHRCRVRRRDRSGRRARGPGARRRRTGGRRRDRHRAPVRADEPVVQADAAPVSPVGIRGISGDPARVPGVAAGRLRVQDEGSQLAALALSRSSEVRAGERWLDMCAGPGGKAALLAAEAQQGGATLVANELVPARAGLVRNALGVFGDHVRVVEGDARRYGRDGTGMTFDRILLDAPCTGLGALRRRPEARWRKLPEDVEELAALQTELLDAAVRVLAPGGTLAYVTCSPHLAETRGQVDALMGRHGDRLEQLDTATIVRGVAARDPEIADGATAQLWPHRIGTDAMFIALFRRVD